MHPQTIFRLIGILVLFLGLFMAGALLVSFIYKDGSHMALLVAMFFTCLLGYLFIRATKKDEETPLSHRDGVAVVTFGWVIPCLVGAAPSMLSGHMPDFTDAYFESVSGFTTTGASILTDIERIPRGILMWRSIIQWLGGMGIIVLSIAILPYLGVGGMQLYKAEIPSPVVDKLKPRISDTAKTLWKVYLLLTVLQILLLSLGGMPFFDSVCHTFCTMPTGGFSTKNASVAYYDSPYFDVIIFLFMLLAGMNFSLHYRFLKGDLAVFWKDTESRVFLIMVAIIILLITLDIHGTIYNSFSSALRYAAFQVSSIISTTGFATADFDKWPSFSKKLLLLCMFLGGMAGSTGGGIKTMRIILLVKHSYQEIFRIIHPHAITSLKLGGRPVPTEVLNSVWGFFFYAWASL